MKHWLLAMALICLGAVKASAINESRDELQTNCTSYGVAVSSSIPTQLFTATLNGATTSFLRLQENRSWLILQTTTTNAGNVYMQLALSSTAANGDLSLTAPTALSTTVPAGFMINSVTTFNQPIASRNADGRVLVPWAQNSSGNGTYTVIVSQCKP